jgi:dihydrofolate reductase
MNLIFSADADWGIGKDNQLLFRLSPDMRNFKEKTYGGVLIIGRKTLESLPGKKPLLGRTHIIMTRSAQGLAGYLGGGREDHQQLWACRDLRELSFCLERLAQPPDKVWVGGGGEIFRLLLPYCGKAYVTRFFASLAADCTMVDLDAHPDWTLCEQGAMQEWEGMPYRFDCYRNEKQQQLQGEA